MSQPSERLKSGVFVVTGASGGLGRALARDLCSRGAQVACLARRAGALEETCNGHPGLAAYPADIAAPKEVEAAFASIRADLGPVTGLINNAAFYPRADMLEQSAEDFMQVAQVNLGGVYACSRAALADMVQTGFGRILNVATFADIAPLPTSSAYSVSKGAARILTRAMIADLADRFPDIVISDWMPGMLKTQMGLPEGLDPAISAKWGASLALWHDRSLTGSVFEQDLEILPGNGLKARLKSALTGQRRTPRRIS